MNRCDQCEAMMINGIYCHETGCPRATQTAECFECGINVTVPVGYPRTLTYCSEECYRIAHGCSEEVPECWDCGYSDYMTKDERGDWVCESCAKCAEFAENQAEEIRKGGN